MSPVQFPHYRLLIAKTKLIPPTRTRARERRYTIRGATGLAASRKVFTYVPCYRITTTFVPTLTRSERSTTSWLVIRMQPDDTAAPIVSGSFDP